MYGRKYYNTNGVVSSGGSITGSTGGKSIDVTGILNDISQLKVDIKTLQTEMQREAYEHDKLSEEVAKLSDRVTVLEINIPKLKGVYTSKPEPFDTYTATYINNFAKYTAGGSGTNY